MKAKLKVITAAAVALMLAAGTVPANVFSEPMVGYAAAAENTGGWEFSDIAADNITPDEEEILNKATEGFEGISLEPVDVIATQVVAGTNYAFLCKGTLITAEPVSEWVVVTVYEDISGEVVLGKIINLDPADLKVKEEASVPESGSWTSEAKKSVAPVSATVQEALASNVGLSLSPIVVLGTQVVAGTNYRMLAYGTYVTSEPFTALFAVTVYEGLDGTAEITEIAPLDCDEYFLIPPVEEEEEPIDLEECDIYIDSDAGVVSVLYDEEEVPADEYTVTFEGVDVDYIGDTFPTDPGKYKVVITANEDSTVLIGSVTDDFTVSDNPSGEISGGWVFTDLCEMNISDEEKKIFDDAFTGFTGSDVTPVDVIAAQTVAGKNLAFLCIVKPVTPGATAHWAIATVYAGLDLTAQLIGMKDIDPADVAVKDSVSDGSISGGWVTEMENTERDMPDEIEGALTPMMGVVYQPIAVLGRQVVAGTNFRVLAYGTTATEDPVTDLYVITVYEGLDGSVEVSDIALFDLEAYISANGEEEEDSVPEDSTPEDSTTDASTAEEADDDSSIPNAIDKGTTSTVDDKSSNPPTGAAAAAGLGAVVLAAAVIATKKKDE